MPGKNFILCAAVAAGSYVAGAKAACSSYVLINARGTGEPAGKESSGFVTMNRMVQSQFPGGSIYNVNYPAAYNQDSSQGTTDIINHVQSYVASNPSICLVLQGYSQGAAAVVNALPMITATDFNAVKAVVLLGDPEHKPGLACNVDQNGGTTTAQGSGIETYEGSIPSNWVSKSLDICYYGDGVCDTSTGFGVTEQHLLYPSSSSVQNMGAAFIERAL